MVGLLGFSTESTNNRRVCGMITLNGYAFIMPHSLAGLSFYPALAVAVLGVLYLLAGRNGVLTFE